MPYYWDDKQQISLPVPAGGVPGGGGGGLFGGLLGGGGGGGAMPGLLSSGDTDALMQQLIMRQLRQATQPNFGAMAAAFAEAAMPSRYPIPIGAALGKAAGALSAGDDNGAKALASLKLLQDMRLAQRKAGWIDQLIADKGGGAAALIEALNPPTAGGGRGGGGGGGSPRVVSPLLPPRVDPQSDVTTGDLSPTVGEPQTDDSAPDPDLFGGMPKPAASAAAPLPVTKAALTGSRWELANNNFGGLRKPGVVAGPSQGGFQSFATPEEGVAAISRQLDRYASGATTGKPVQTLREIVSTWAPPHENPTEALIARAARIVNVDPDALLDVSNPQIKAKLIEATIANEQGGRVPVGRDLIARVAASAPSGATADGIYPSQSPTRALGMTAAPSAVALQANGQPIPPPRNVPGAWYNQPNSGGGFNDPSFDHRAAQERFRQSVLGQLAGGAPASDAGDPSQSPTRAMSGDPVISSGPPPALPGLLRAQYSGAAPYASQSPAAVLGQGGAPPPAPTQPPVMPGVMAPGQAPPVAVPNVAPPMPANMDPSRIQAIMLDLARKSMISQALGLPDVFKDQIQILQQSPQYQAMVDYQKKVATLPLDVQLEIAKRQSEYLGPQADPLLQQRIKDLQERVTAAQRETEIEIGNRKHKVTAEEAGQYERGEGIPRLGIPPAGSGAPGSGTRGGVRTYTPEETKSREKMGADAAQALTDTHAAEIAAGRRTQLFGQMAEAMEAFKPGATAEVRLRTGQILKDVFGVDYTGVPSAELFQQAARQLQLAAAPKGQGSVSNYERELYASAVPTMINSPESLTKAIDIARRLDEYDIKVAQIHRQVARENNGVPNLLEAQDRISKLGPPLSPGEMRALERVKEGKVPGPATNAPQYKTGDTFQRGGKSYRVTGGDPSNPDIEEIRR